MAVSLGGHAHFSVSALGPIAVEFESAKGKSRLSSAKQATVARLVAAGIEGITSGQFEPGRSPTERNNNAALRMAIARVRDHFPKGALPPAVDGRYRLHLSSCDVDVWRLVELAGPGSPLDFDPAELPWLLSPSEPYEGIADSPLIAQSVRTIRRCQRELFERLSQEEPSSLKGEVLDSLVEHYREDPFNESLLSLVAVSQASAGHRRLGLRTLSEARRAFGEVGLPLSNRVEDLEMMLIEGGSGAESAPLENKQRALPVAVTAQIRGTYMEEQTHLGRLKIVAEGIDDGTTCVVVSGESGVGKSRLTAELATVADQLGMRVVYVTPSSQSGEGIFGGLMASLPALRRLTMDVIGKRLDSDSTRSLLWAGASDALSAVAQGHPLLLVVDDFQWLDSQTQAYLRHLTSGSFESPLLVLLVGRDDQGGDRSWAHMRAETVKRGAPEFVVMPFEVSSINRLVRVAHPQLSERMALTVAGEVHLASRGLPGIASLLIEDLDDELHMVPSLRRLTKDHPLDALVSSLVPDVRVVGAAASVLGLDFKLESLTAILSDDEGSVLAAVQVLVGRDLLIERSSSEFSFAHILVQAAFARSVIGAQISKWHQSASEHFQEDLHRRAHHEAAALPRTVPSLAVASLLESARLYMKQGLFRESVRRFRRSEILGDGPMALSDERDFARALDLAGSTESAQRVRSVAVERSLSLGQQELALSIATSGLPETEPIDGDAAVVASLQRIDPTSMDRSTAWTHSNHLARQLALLGQLEEAGVRAADATSLARSPYEVVCSAISTRLAVSASASSRERLDLLLSVAESARLIESEKRAEYLFLLAIDHYEIGDRISCDDVLAEVGRLERFISPVRRWHGMLFKAMICAETGEPELCATLRLAAHRFGIRSGISESDNGLLTAACVDKMAEGRLPELLAVVESGSLEQDGPIIARAGMALILSEAGRRAEGLAIAEQVARHVLKHPISQGNAALALVSLPLADSKHTNLIDMARDQLLRRGESMIVIGAGVACLGPTSIYLAHLAGDVPTAYRHLEDAIEFASRVGFDRWGKAAQRQLLAMGGAG